MMNKLIERGESAKSWNEFLLIFSLRECIQTPSINAPILATTNLQWKRAFLRNDLNLAITLAKKKKFKTKNLSLKDSV